MYIAIGTLSFHLRLACEQLMSEKHALRRTCPRIKATIDGGTKTELLTIIRSRMINIVGAT